MMNTASLSFRLFLVVALALLAALAVAAPRSTSAGGPYVVTKTLDTADGACDADCSLREAVIAANASPADITLPSGTYNMTIPDAPFVEDNLAATGDLDINAAYAINGEAADTTIIDAGGQTRVFHMRAANMANTISGVTLRNGLGAIYVSTGTLTLNNSTVSGNTTAQSVNGGGIFNQATLIVNNSTFSGNVAQGYGGGIYSFSGGTATITNSTISGNTSKFGGGGVFNGTPGTTTLTNVTLYANTATDIANSGGNIRKDGTGGTVTLKNTIVADSPSGNCFGTITTQGGNLDTDSSCNMAGSATGAAHLLPLTLNAPGTTETHALSPASLAINNALGCPPPTTDQRGVSRPLGAACDTGAYEADPRGDTDCDGDVDGDDLLDVLSDIGDVGTTAECIVNGDVNGDTQRTAMDALLIAQHMAGVITTFPSNG